MSTFIIADDHPVTLAGMESFVKKLGHKVLGTHDNGIHAYNQIIALQPDYAILDLSMPSMNGLEVLEKIRKENKTIKIIIYTMYTETTLFDKAVALGVNGYILKEFALLELEECINNLRINDQWFSPKLQQSLIFKETDTVKERLMVLTASEKKILTMISEEKNSKQIAELLFLAEKTVENHRSNIIKKLNLPNTKNALLIWALQNKKDLD